jgi:hypothetical protein
MNNLPSCWQVQNDGSQLFKDTVVKYINDNYERDFDGSLNGYYYGYKIDSANNPTRLNDKACPNVTILTLQEFINLTTDIKAAQEVINTKLPTKWCISRTPDTAKVINDWFNNQPKHRSIGQLTANTDYYTGMKTSKPYWKLLHYPIINNKINYDSIQEGYTEINFEQFKQIINMSNKPKSFAVKSDKQVHLQSFKECLIELGYPNVSNTTDYPKYVGIEFGCMSNRPEVKVHAGYTSSNNPIFNLPQDYNKALDFAKEQLALIKPTEIEYNVKLPHTNFNIKIEKNGDIAYPQDIRGSIRLTINDIKTVLNTTQKIKGNVETFTVIPRAFDFGCMKNISRETLEEIVKLYSDKLA